MSSEYKIDVNQLTDNELAELLSKPYDGNFDIFDISCFIRWYITTEGVIFGVGRPKWMPCQVVQYNYPNSNVPILRYLDSAEAVPLLASRCLPCTSADAFELQLSDRKSVLEYLSLFPSSAFCPELNTSVNLDFLACVIDDVRYHRI